MGPSYDAQRNEFCAYVLNETQTPYGLLLGNYKAYAQSTAKGGVRGLWDADTDQIIFGTHHIAYRLIGADVLPASDSARSDLPSVRTDLRVHPRASRARYRSLLRSARPGFDRAVSFVVDVTLYNPGGTDVEVSLYPVGDARRSAFLRRTRTRSARLERRPLHLFAQPRNRRRTLVGRLAHAGRRADVAARASIARSRCAPRFSR